MICLTHAATNAVKSHLALSTLFQRERPEPQLRAAQKTRENIRRQCRRPVNGRYSYWTWWINRSAISQPPSGCFSSVGSPDGPPHPGVRLHVSASAGTFPLSPRHDTAPTSGFNASQAETGGNGRESTSRAV